MNECFEVAQNRNAQPRIETVLAQCPAIPALISTAKNPLSISATLGDEFVNDGFRRGDHAKAETTDTQEVLGIFTTRKIELLVERWHASEGIVSNQNVVCRAQLHSFASWKVRPTEKSARFYPSGHLRRKCRQNQTGHRVGLNLVLRPQEFVQPLRRR